MIKLYIHLIVFIQNLKIFQKFNKIINHQYCKMKKKRSNEQRRSLKLQRLCKNFPDENFPDLVNFKRRQKVC